MKNLLGILSAIYFFAVPLRAQDATVSFDNLILQTGTEMAVPLNMIDLVSDTEIESNMTMISSIMCELLSTITSDREINIKLAKAAQKLGKSLKSEYWLDGNHLTDKKGENVFEEGEKAVTELQKILMYKKMNDSVAVIIENNIQNLMSVYHCLALISIEEDRADFCTDKCIRQIEKRYNEMEKAEKEIDKGHHKGAINKYKKAWKKNEKKGKKLRKQLSEDRQGIAADTSIDYNLMQNFPNPFNPSTLIGFSLPETMSVRLVVFNTIGEEVEVLAEGIYSAGYHTVQFNAKNINAGIYLYRLETDDFVDIKKMILVK
jgi:hypothetical protein